jgi:hypothetical protein
MPAQERDARSKLAKILHDRPFLRASLVTMAHACGKPNCRCARGEKHVSLYLATRIDNQRKMIYVPKPLEDMVKAWVQTYQQAGQLSQRISAECLKAFLRKKKQCSSARAPAPSRDRCSAGRSVKKKASKKAAAARKAQKATSRRVKSC